MESKKLLNRFLVIILCLISFSSCKKDWLDAKPVQSITNPKTIKDFQALMDNSTYFTQAQPASGEVGADNYYIKDISGQTLDRQNMYTWNSADVFPGGNTVDWTIQYQAILYANIVLEGIVKITPDSTTKDGWNNAKGSALFCRAYAYFNIAQLFCKAYYPMTAQTDLGVILRLSPDVNLPSVRASVKESYDQIIADLTAAKSLLPVTPLNKLRPSRPAAFAMLARVYLAIQDYENAFLYADSCLQLYSTLLAYKDITFTGTYAFGTYASLFNNPEVIYHTQMTNNALFPNSLGAGYIDTTLFASYGPTDLRKNIFYTQTTGVPPRTYYRGSYVGNMSNFNGLACDEIYLIRAECNARKGNTGPAMSDLNTLLRKRHTTAFIDLQANSAVDALNKILIERRKELVFRGARWTDLRRLNQESQYAVTLTRGIINGQPCNLPPNDNRYVYPIPDNEIVYSGVPQNPR